MAGGASDWMEGQFLNHVFKNVAIFTPPATTYLGVSTTALTDASTGASLTEPTDGTAYANRLDIGTGEWTLSAVEPMKISNTAQVQYPQATTNWGTLLGIALCNSDTKAAGQIYFWSDINKPVGQNDQLIFTAGNLAVTFT